MQARHRTLQDAARAALACRAVLMSAAPSAGDALLNAGRICAATGAALLCENAFARADRGGGLPCPDRLPYFPDAAAAELSKYSLLVLVDARRPVATFGYQCALSLLHVALLDGA